MSSALTSTKLVKVWDPLLRVLHWVLAGSIALALVTGDEAMTVHLWAGLAALGVVVTRILWGLVGPRHARFGDFVPTPAEALRHLHQLVRGEPGHHAGHNPAAGAMVIALWLMVLAVVASGLATLGGSGGELLEELHEGLAWTLLGLIGLHIGGVVVSSLVEGQNLARAMFTGRKKALP
jgi:cytochrome b